MLIGDCLRPEHVHSGFKVCQDGGPVNVNSIIYKEIKVRCKKDLQRIDAKALTESYAESVEDIGLYLYILDNLVTNVL